jgi:hypothetical protein
VVRVSDKYEEAIRFINIMQSSYNHIRKSDAEFLTLELAKEALRAEQEREKGCEYCTVASASIEDGRHHGACYGGNGLTMVILEDGQLLVNVRGDGSSVPILNCFHCGRRLSSRPKEQED